MLNPITLIAERTMDDIRQMMPKSMPQRRIIRIREGRLSALKGLSSIRFENAVAAISTPLIKMPFACEKTV